LDSSVPKKRQKLFELDSAVTKTGSVWVLVREKDLCEFLSGTGEK
jgi:hypothetical protein